ncbi:MAG: hypothetical protein GF383_09260 [Candidatus Lokiarchaeota archaeon]|nr:hypothetical protein [Candidatus Lokiarchaeota archaeon]MBD3340698.1 hypothetical protein [Candidatus Lokiarchaeota archaeon]
MFFFILEIVENSKNNKSEIKEFRFECTRCGKCCTDKTTLVNVTYHDILRIKENLNLTLDELLEVIGFYIFEEQLSEEDRKKMVTSPISTEHGPAFVGLLKNAEGSCYFYDKEKKRCKIYKLRPMFCRTFPFSFRLILNQEDKTKAKIKMRYTEKGKKYCPGITKDAPLVDLSEWIKVGKQTLEELNDNYVLMEKWNEAVEKKAIEPNAKNFLRTVLNLSKKETKKK